MFSMLLVTLALMALLRMPQIFVERRNSLHSPGDISGHLLIHEAMREKGIEGADYNPRFLFDGSGYPAGFHWLCSKILRNEKVFLRFGFFIPLCADASTVVLAATIGWHLGAKNWGWLLLFAVSPLLWMNAGRASHINERAFGSLFGNIFMISLLFFVQKPSVIAGAGLLLGMALISSSSKFTLQAVTFVSVTYSIVSLNLFPMLLVVASWIIANFALLGYPKTVLKGLLSHSRHYRKHLMKKIPETARNFPKELGMFWRNRGHLASNWLVRIFVDSPLHLVVLGYFVYFPELVDSWMILSLATVAVSLIVSLPPLTFLGESYRYLEVGLVGSFLFLAIHVDNLVLTLTLVGLFLFRSVQVQIFRLLRGAAGGQLIDQSYAELGTFFSSLPEGRALSVPGRLSIFLARCNPKVKHLWILSHVGEGASSDKFFEILGNRYPYPVRDVPGIYRLQPFEHLVVDTYAAPDWFEYAARLAYLSEIWGNGRFFVYRINPEKIRLRHNLRAEMS